MSPAARILGLVALATLTLTAAALDDTGGSTLNRTKEYELASHVFDGIVKEITFLDEDGKAATTGPRYTLDLTVKRVHKPKDEAKVKNGDVVTIQARTTDKEMKRKYFVPKVKMNVIAFVKQTKDGKYEALEPKGVIRNVQKKS